MIDYIELAATLIDVFEGDRLTAYKDSGGVWTIGKGHTGPEVHEGLVITKEQDLEYFKQDIAHLINGISGINLNSFQKAAIISFGYNCGYSKMMDVLFGTDTITNPVHYTDKHGNILNGLIHRRNLENMLFTN